MSSCNRKRTDVVRGGNKKLIAGIWYGLKNTERDPKTGAKTSQGFDCGACKGRKKTARNCGNVKKYKDTIIPTAELKMWAGVRAVQKPPGYRLFECPLTAITNQTWDIIRIVNQTSDDNGSPNNMTYQGLLDLPPWLRQAYEITQRIRAEFNNRRAK